MTDPLTNRHYRVWVVETRTVEVDVRGAADDLDAQRIAKQAAAPGADVDGAHVVKRDPVKRRAGMACWMNRPDDLKVTPDGKVYR